MYRSNKTIAALGKSRKPKSNLDVVKLIVRTAQRYPSNAVLQTLESLRRALKDILLTFQSEKETHIALAFLISQSPGVRGGFLVNKPSGLVSFLQSKSHLPSSLAMGLSTILNAFCTVCIDIAMVHRMAENDLHRQLITIACRYECANWVPVHNRYPSKLNEAIYTQKPTFQLKQRTLSEVSIDDPERERIPGKPFDKVRKMKPCEGGWLHEALKAGVPVISHVSGSVYFALSIAMNILKIELSDDEIKALAGVMLLPQLLRGNLHSLAESAAGVHHYLSERRSLPGRLLPHEAEVYALHCMALGIGVPASDATKITSIISAKSIIDQYLSDKTKVSSAKGEGVSSRITAKGHSPFHRATHPSGPSGNHLHAGSCAIL